MLHPEEIIDLSEFLNRQGFHTTPYQVFAARRLLLSESVRNGGAKSLVRFSSLLRPIFCSTPEDQAKFDEFYFDWLRQRSARPPTVWVTERENGNGPEPPRIHWRMKVVAVALLMLPTLTVWFLWQDLRPRQVIGQVMSEGQAVPQAHVWLGKQTPTTAAKTDPDGKFSLLFHAKDMPMDLAVEKAEFLPSRTPIGENIKSNRYWLYLNPIDWSDQLNIGDIFLSKVTESGRPPPKLSLEKIATVKSLSPRWWARLDYEILGKVLMPVLLVLSWLLYRHTRHLGLQRQSGRIPPELKHVPIRAGTQQIFPSLSLRHLTQRLRQSRFVESDELDVLRTIHLTMQRGGLFTPAYGTKREPGYVAFIDRSTMADHQAHLAGQLVKDLARGSVLVRQYEFDEHPIMLRRVDPLRPTPRYRAGGTGLATALDVVPLEMVQAKFPVNRLLVFADPLTCFDPLTGKLRPWVETLEGWDERFLFTTSADHHWGQAERILSRRGFQVIPLSLLGLRLFSSLLETGRGNGSDQPGRFSGTTGFHDRMPDRWLERHPPSPALIERLLASLEHDFSQEQGGVNAERGKQGMLWLSACAAYPEIHWALTREWGIRLFPQRQDAEVLLPKLTRLIWFRQAFMPDWFRQALYDRLTGPEADRLEEKLSEILSAVNPEADEGLQLRIATQPGEPSESPEPVGRLRARFRRFQRKLKWQAVGQAAEPGNPMGDYVMLQYLSGKQGKALTPYAPKALRKLLFPKGQPWLGFRPAFLMVFAVVMSGGLWWWWDPIHPLFAILFLVFLSVQIWLHIKMYDVLLPLAGVVTLVLVLAGINHLTFGFMESWGWVCESTAGPLKQNTSPEVTLQTKSLCQASGIELIKGKQYRLTMTINDGWKDNEIPADTTGVNPDQGALALYLGLPFRRHWTEPWFSPMARIGETGSDVYPLKQQGLEPPGQPANKLIYEFTARSTGELYLYVNDVVLPVPKNWQAFYTNNRGTATVEIIPLYLNPDEQLR